MAEIFEWCPWVNTWVSARLQSNGFSQPRFPCEKVALFRCIQPSDDYDHNHDHKRCNPHGTTFLEMEWLIRRRLLGMYKYIAENDFLQERWKSYAGSSLRQDSCKLVHGCQTGQDSVKQAYGYGLCQSSFKLEYEQKAVQDDDNSSCDWRRLQHSADIVQLRWEVDFEIEDKTGRQPAATAEPCRYCYVADSHLRWCPNAQDDVYVRTQAEARWRKMGEYLRRNL